MLQLLYYNLLQRGMQKGEKGRGTERERMCVVEYMFMLVAIPLFPVLIPANKMTLSCDALKYSPSYGGSLSHKPFLCAGTESLIKQTHCFCPQKHRIRHIVKVFLLFKLNGLTEFYYDCSISILDHARISRS